MFLKRFVPGRHRVREAVKRALGLAAARREWRALVSLHARGVRCPSRSRWPRSRGASS